jgi:hypothetical protein
MATKLDRLPKECFNAEGLKASGPLVLEIKEERLEDIIDPKTGRAVEKSVVAFIDAEQKLVSNATNWELIADITGSSPRTTGRDTRSSFTRTEPEWPHSGWLLYETARFLSDVIEHFGRPTEPVRISRDRHIERQAAVNIDNQT